MAGPKLKSIPLTASRAERRLKRYLTRARAIPTLARCLRTKTPWTAEARMVSAPVMRRLNRTYRRNDYATDILSFPAPEVFRETGILGELVICTAMLNRQAKEQGHSAERELDILLVHGILHLLGFDHERGPREAVEMARWERKLLGLAGARGLIARAHSGKS